MRQETFELVSLAKGAALIDCSPESLALWAKAGYVPYVSVEGPRRVERVFRRVDLLTFAATRAAERAKRQASA